MKTIASLFAAAFVLMSVSNAEAGLFRQRTVIKTANTRTVVTQPRRLVRQDRRQNRRQNVAVNVHVNAPAIVHNAHHVVAINQFRLNRLNTFSYAHNLNANILVTDPGYVVPQVVFAQPSVQYVQSQVQLIQPPVVVQPPAPVDPPLAPANVPGEAKPADQAPPVAVQPPVVQLFQQPRVVYVTPHVEYAHAFTQSYAASTDCGGGGVVGNLSFHTGGCGISANRLITSNRFLGRTVINLR